MSILIPNSGSETDCVLVEKQAERYCRWWLFVGRNVKLLLVSHLQGQGEWKMTSRSGERSIWSPLPAAQSLIEPAVPWDLLPASGTSSCGRFGSRPTGLSPVYFSPRGLRMKASSGHTQHYDDKYYHYIFNQKCLSLFPIPKSCLSSSYHPHCACLDHV